MSASRSSLTVSLFLGFAAVAWSEAPVRNDAFGDPLPDGAFARLGTNRFRSGGYRDGADLSPDGKTFAAIKYREMLQLWDVTTGRVRGKVALSNGGYGSLTWSPDGRWLATISFGDGLTLYDAATGREVRRLGDDQLRRGATFSADGRFVTAGSDLFGQENRGVFVWNTATGEQHGPFTPVQKDRVSAVLSGDGRFLATWGQHSPRGQDPAAEVRLNATVQLWDVCSGKERCRFVAQARAVGNVEFAPDGRSIALTNDYGGTIEVWETASARLRLMVAGRSGQGRALLFSPDGRQLIGAAHEGTVQVWDLVDGSRIATHSGPHCQFRGLRRMPEGRLLAWGYREAVPVIWEVGGQLLTPLPGHDSGIKALGFLAGGRELATVDTSGRLIFWDTAGKELRQADLRDENDRRGQNQMSSIELSQDGRFLVAGSDFQGQVRVFEMPGVREVCAFVAGVREAHPLAVSDDGSTLVMGSGREGGWSVWDVATSRQLLPQASGRNNYGQVLALSPDGKTLASYVGKDRDSELRLWDTTGKMESRAVPAAAGVHGLAFSADSRLLAGAIPNTIRLWKLPSREPLQTLSGDADGVPFALRFSPDGRCLAAIVPIREKFAESASGEAIVVWELATGTQRHRFRGHRGTATALAFCPDSRILASGGSDTSVLLWDLDGRRTLPAAKLTADQLVEAWTGLAAAEAKEAWPHLARLVGSPAEAVALLREQLKPATEKGDALEPRQARAVEVLEHCDTAEARQLLEALAKGHAEAALTAAARAARARLGR
jgi:WD40 repeat protein